MQREEFDGKHVLVVEDEYFIAEEVRETLTNVGVTVLGPVSTSVAALERLARGPRPDAAVLDIRLRSEDVYRVAEILRERKVPFIFATGYSKDAIDGHFADVPSVEKPFTPAKLLSALQSVL
jgi:CheY-like chemotaxis protein